jgi:hypothetical protein
MEEMLKLLAQEVIRTCKIIKQYESGKIKRHINQKSLQSTARVEKIIANKDLYSVSKLLNMISKTIQY